MLKQTKTASSERPSGKVRLAVIGTLVAIGLFSLGLRAPGPIIATQVIAAEPVDENSELSQETKPDKPASEKNTDGYDFAYIPENFLAMLAIRPADMAKSTHLAPLAELMAEYGRPSLPSDAVEQVTIALLFPQFPKPGQKIVDRGGEYSILRMNRAFDFKKNLETRYGPMKTERHHAKEYWTWSPLPGRIAYHSPDEKTLLGHSRPGLFKVIDNPQAAHPPAQAAAWQEQATGPIFGILNVKAYREIFGGKLLGGFIFQTIAPVLNNAGNITFTVDDQDEPVLKIKITCKSPQEVPAVEQTVRSALVLLGNIVTSQMKALEGRTNEFPSEELISASKELYYLASTIIENAKITSEGNMVRLTAPLGDAATILQVLVPQIKAAGIAAKRVQSANNIRKIALAMLNYESAHGHFPPAVLYDKKTGTPYSWRVAILPYLEQNEVYKLYRFDEPWDSENNKKVLEYRPMQLLSPTDPSSTNTAYLLLTGPETVFTGKKGTKFVQIRDGSANTLLLVEAKRDIPWTKPEDIPYAPEKPLPKLGGFFKSGFHVAFCDGSVHFMAEDVDQKTLRHLIEKADGNVVD